MFNLMDYPLLVLVVALPVFWAASRLGRRLRERQTPWDAESDGDYRFILGGTLTLLGLLVGFTFLACIIVERPALIEFLKQAILALAFILWGIVMLLFGLIMFIMGRRQKWQDDPVDPRPWEKNNIPRP